MSMYARRLNKNHIWLGLSIGAAAFGLMWLVLILGTLIWNGVSGLSVDVFTRMTPPPGSAGGLLNPIVGSLVMTVLAVLIATLAIYTGLASLVLHRFPPFFTPPYFLMLTTIEALTFGALVTIAIRRRRQTEWHRRLMIGATIVILEPALGRTLPIPLMGPWAEPAVALCQLFVVALIAAHDRRTRGAVHPATWVLAAIVIAVRVTISLLAMTPPVIALATRLAGG